MSARLRTSIPHPRLAPYERAVASTRIDAIELYAWNRSISLALFDEIATLEVAMRSAMATELVATFGLQWFADDGLFDDDAEAAIMQAWRQGGLAALEREGAAPETIHGKLVASFMFGFWVKLLGKGEYSRKNEPLKRRRIYDTTLWKPCLRRAFPHVDDLARATVQAAAKHVQFVRNRIAHHEHVIWGIPIADRKDADGATLRLDVSEAHAMIVTLAGYLDAGLAEWIDETSSVREQLARCPLPVDVAAQVLRLGETAVV